MKSGFVNAMWIGKIGNPVLLAAISNLSPEAQLALNFHFWKRLSIREIARKLRIREDAVAKILRETIEALRVSMPRARPEQLTGGSAA